MKNKILKALLCSASICCLMGLVSCGNLFKDPETPPVQDDLSGYIHPLEVDKTEITLQAGETFQLNAQTDEGLTIHYTSTDESVAVVDATGKISAVGLGAAEIVVSVGDFTQVRVLVNVEQVVIHYHSVELGVSDVNLRIGETFNVDADVYYQGAKVENATLQYASEIQAIATVDVAGKITAVNTGSTDIKVSYVVDGETKASSVVSVTVIGDYTMTAELVNEKGYFMPGETLKANVLSIVDSDGKNVTYQSNEIAWISSNPSVVEVSNGDITAVKSGSAYVTVAYQYGAAVTFEIKVAKTIYRPSEFIDALQAGGTYVLFDDLDMTGYTVSGNIQFDGLLDGNYHEVKNLSRQAGTWSGNSVGEAAFFKEITAGSTVKNIAFTNYKILGMAVQSGFVQTNNGTLENLVLTMTRDTSKPAGWEQPGAGLLCGSVLTWVNNGAIKNSVVYNLSGAGENYAMAAAINNGTIDGIYGFIESDEDGDGDSSNNPINIWASWRGTCNVGMVWQKPNGGDYDSIVSLIGAGSNAATNSVALNGFGDTRLANTNFNDEFMSLVKSTFIKCEIPQVKIYLAKETPVNLDTLINPTTVNAFGFTFEYEIADDTLATIENNVITGVVSGKTNLYVYLKDGDRIIRSVKMPCNVQRYVLNYDGGDALDINKNTTDAIVSLNVKDGISIQDNELSALNYEFKSTNSNVATVDPETGAVTPGFEGTAEIYAVIEGEEYFITQITVRSWIAISTPQEFAALNPATTARVDREGYYYLTADLDMSEVENYVWTQWTTFTGILDGNNHVISNLKKQGVTWVEGLAGVGAFIGTLNEGSIVRNIGLVNYTILGGASQAGFVQTNDGTIENVLFMLTRDTSAASGWLSSGMGLVCGSTLTWKNNGTIKNCVIYHLLSAEEHYAIAAANNQGTIDGVYGFIYSESSTPADTSDDRINIWAGWRGTYNIGITWTNPNGGDFGSISTVVGVTNSNEATNSAAINGFDDPVLTAALASFDEGFVAMVTKYYKAQ